MFNVIFSFYKISVFIHKLGMGDPVMPFCWGWCNVSLCCLINYHQILSLATQSDNVYKTVHSETTPPMLRTMISKPYDSNQNSIQFNLVKEFKIFK